MGTPQEGTEVAEQTHRTGNTVDAIRLDQTHRNPVDDVRAYELRIMPIVPREPATALR